MAAKDKDEQPIIIKKVKKGGHGGHHGGQWKVAYADFVTAMMAFFLMLWLLNATSEEQRSGIADYFSPVSVSESTSGGGGMLSGQTVAKEGALVHNQSPMGINAKLPPAENLDSPDDSEEKDGDPGSAEADLEAARAKERERFENTQKQLNDAIREAGLSDLKDQVRIDRTPEGLRIQIIDQLNKPMFASGSAEPLPHTRALLARVATSISDLPNKVAIKGHTDATPFTNRPDYSNWELSSERANASRRVLMDSGLQPNRVSEVTGRADEDLLVPDNPTSPRNRRISIVLERETPLPPTTPSQNSDRAATADDGTITATESPESEPAPQQEDGPSITEEIDGGNP